MFLLSFFRSSIGQKVIMAATGLLLFGFVVAHMLGNLQIFVGSEAINGYAHFLKSTPEILWSARIGLFLIVVLHIVSAIGVTRANRAARPVGYEEKKIVRADWASRTMMVSGSIVLFFIVYHLLHFTVGVIKPDSFAVKDSLGHHDVFRMMTEGFRVPGISIFYIISVGFLCLHLSHGLSSMFYSLGLRSKPYEPLQEWFARIFSLIIFLGMAIVPVAVLAGWVH
jgi:succinate dehydrogenase / fumarate reductase cytochrome b subunit